MTGLDRPGAVEWRDMEGPSTLENMVNLLDGEEAAQDTAQHNQPPKKGQFSETRVESLEPKCLARQMVSSGLSPALL